MPFQPYLNPITSHPFLIPPLTTARITALRPGQSPPPVKIPILVVTSYPSLFAEPRHSNSFDYDWLINNFDDIDNKYDLDTAPQHFLKPLQKLILNRIDQLWQIPARQHRQIRHNLQSIAFHLCFEVNFANHVKFSEPLSYQIIDRPNRNRHVSPFSIKHHIVITTGLFHKSFSKNEPHKNK